MTTTSPSDADRAAVAAVPQRVVDAWAEHDAEAFAGVFTEDGSMILPGLYRKGRQEIRSFMAEAFEGPFKGTQVTGRPIDIRFLSETTGVLITQGGVLAPGETEVSPERAAALVCAVAYPRITRAEWGHHFPGMPYEPPCR
ncbi:SgcJ/EcaC family oxidoreductase [Streptosporangium algeriense]|uniref:SgcJ/EcaC family oxidoreductase n=1 Tax=Streptosporangium algeriense TaxID=1682748 RepID=A0ABW3E652_9ACTN